MVTTPSFNDAILRTSQVIWDLQYHGNAILFSWPSRGQHAVLLKYDRNSALFARAHFIALLRILEHDAGIKKVHVLCHSMGNFAVLDALATFVKTVDPPKIAQLIMAAPDIDRDQFRQDIKEICADRRRHDPLCLIGGSSDHRLAHPGAGAAVPAT